MLHRGFLMGTLNHQSRIERAVAIDLLVKLRRRAIFMGSGVSI